MQGLRAEAGIFGSDIQTFNESIKRQIMARFRISIDSTRASLKSSVRCCTLPLMARTAPLQCNLYSNNSNLSKFHQLSVLFTAADVNSINDEVIITKQVAF